MVELTFKSDGKVMTVGTDTVSDNVKTYTYSAKGTNAQGQAFTVIQVFERQ